MENIHTTSDDLPIRIVRARADLRACPALLALHHDHGLLFSFVLDIPYSVSSNSIRMHGIGLLVGGNKDVPDR